MRLNRFSKAVLALSLVTAAAAMLVSVAGASGLQFSAGSATRESNIIDPLSRHGEAAPADLNQALVSTLTVARNEIKYVADVET